MIMKKKTYEGYTYVDGGVCAAKGFVANGINCGLNSDKNKNDLGMVYSSTVCNAAAVYTQNKVKGAPILVTKEHLKATGGKAMAVVVNSKNANTCNADGVEKAERICELAADALGIDADMIINASTGVIGQIIPIEPFEEHMKELAGGLSADGNDKAANAIMTTDTVDKQVAVEFTLGGKTCRLGGMAKGSGMIHPNMATTLNFITTDVAISADMIQKALKEIVTENDDYAIFKKALYIVMECMTMMLASDGEGASKMLECTVSGAPDQDTAIIVAKSIIRSPLTKCAMFGEDANWGRILCAIGYAEADFDIDKVDVDLESEKGIVEVCRNGSGIPFSEEKASEVLSEDDIYINVNLNQGEASAKAWGCDLTYDYVKINGDYRS